VGLPSALFRLALANRFAYPLAGVPAALLAALIAMRRTKSGLTGAFVEGLLLCTALWGLMVVARSLVMAGRVPPPVAAWLPLLALTGMCAAELGFPSLRRRLRLG
jgi:lipopolysaccharide export system permease protein